MSITDRNFGIAGGVGLGLLGGGYLGQRLALKKHPITDEERHVINQSKETGRSLKWIDSVDYALEDYVMDNMQELDNPRNSELTVGELEEMAINNAKVQMDEDAREEAINALKKVDNEYKVDAYKGSIYKSASVKDIAKGVGMGAIPSALASGAYSYLDTRKKSLTSDTIKEKLCENIVKLKDIADNGIDIQVDRDFVSNIGDGDELFGINGAVLNSIIEENGLDYRDIKLKDYNLMSDIIEDRYWEDPIDGNAERIVRGILRNGGYYNR